MKIVLLSARNSRYSGGLFYSVRHLGLSLLNHCNENVVYVSHNDKFSETDLIEYDNLPLNIYHLVNLPFFKRFGYSLDLMKILESERPDIIDIQGIWMYYSWAALRYKKKHPSVKIVITPRGTLNNITPDTMSIQKKIVYRLFEKENLENADCIRALCMSEYNDIRAFGLKTPVAVIPNGYNLPKMTPEHKTSGPKILLYVGRINPKKGIKELFLGLSHLKDTNPDSMSQWHLRMAGWGQDKYVEEVKNYAKECGIEDFVTFIGPKYGKEKEQEMLNADAFVLTSHGEGMPMSVLEAWAYKLPSILTDGCNLPEGFTANAAIRVSLSPEDIATGLKTLFEMSEQQRYEMGHRAYDLVKLNYQWDDIAQKSVGLYNYLLGFTSKPDYLYD